jgi:hypothetical protein
VEIAAGLVIALVLGGMAFFSFVFSPLVFFKLPTETAGPFMRAVFPWYFLAIAVLFAVAAVLLWSQPGLAVLMAAMAVLGMGNRQVMMPRINRMRDRFIAGEAGAEKRFDRLHRASVGINLMQMAAAVLGLVLLLG